MMQAVSRCFIVIVLMVCSYSASAYDANMRVPDLSESATASLLTVGRKGDEIYRNFGHTAIRIKDSILGWDLVYNYGTFNYGEPGFLMKFIRCTLMYYESIDDYPEFEEMYREENRWIREQPLNLTQQEKQLLFERLTVNAREENKYYRYDFLFDNCSTRPRDMVLSLFKKVEFKEDEDDQATYRELIDRNVKDEWLDLGMDILIGIPTDKKAHYGRTFLPLELMQLFDGAVVDGKPLVKGNYMLLDVVPEHEEMQWFTPGVAFWIFFFAVLMLQVKFSLFSKYKILPVIYFSILGIFGWLFLFMWFGTEHSSTKWNLNILWAMPFNMPFMFFLLKKKLPRCLVMYVKIYRVILITLLVAWWANPQTFHASVIPLILAAILFASIFLPIPLTADFKRRWFG